MKVTGIIAEYNPFHNGHLYQLQQLRRLQQSDFVVVAMSGDFMQRGAPALINKYARSAMALQSGVDLLLELPCRYATASAREFACGGVALLASTGVVDSLAFGAECPDLEKLKELASILSQEPVSYQEKLQEGLKNGLSFPAARSAALPDFCDILSSPNNILAIEYLRALSLLAPDMKPILIPRAGAGYHDTALLGTAGTTDVLREFSQEPSELLLSSATAIRKKLKESPSSPLPAELLSALPPASQEILSDYARDFSFLWEDDFSLLLHQALLKKDATDLATYEDISPKLASRLAQGKHTFTDWQSFALNNKSKEITYSRVSRGLTHILLDIKKNGATTLPDIKGNPSIPGEETPSERPESETPLHTSYSPYLRVLGFREDAAPLLGAISKAATAPLLTSLSDAPHRLSSQALDLLETDLYASDLYRSVLTQKIGRPLPNEYQRKLLVVRE